MRTKIRELIGRRDGYLKPEFDLKYRCYEADSFYILAKVGSDLVKDYMVAADNPAFWEHDQGNIFDDSEILWYLKKLGMEKNLHFAEEIDELLTRQNVEGHIQSNEADHCGPMRVLVAVMPHSKPLENAINYWLRQWKNYTDYPATIAAGILALTELDFDSFSDYLHEMANSLIQLQNEDCSWAFSSSFKKGEGSLNTTSYVTSAIARIEGVTGIHSRKGLEWILGKQVELGWWGDIYHTTPALLALLAMGEGPKVAAEQIDLEFMRREQAYKKSKPIFVHTSPLYHSSLHVREINDMISGMIHRAKKEIRITTPFVDMFYEDLINLVQEKPELKIKVITRPKSEIGGFREKIAKNVIDLLSTLTKGNLVQSRIVHSRMVIIDNEEVLVSSADLTRDQLFDEFNAGIWTAEKDAVLKAIEFFENIFEIEKGNSEKVK